MKRITGLIVMITAALVAIAGAALALPSDSTSDDTLLVFGYDEANHVLVAGQSPTDGPYDCTAPDGPLTVTYGSVIDDLIPVDMLANEDLSPVEFGNRSPEDVGPDYEPADTPAPYAGADGTCGLNGITVAGPNGQINHGQFMKAFHQLMAMKGHGCLNRIIAQSDLGKGDTQKLRTGDVDPAFEQSDEGIISLSAATTACSHGKDKPEDHPSNAKPDKPGKDKKPNRGRDK